MENSFDLIKRKETAIQLFGSGMNCSQSVLLAFPDYLDGHGKMAVSIACGFGAGMGRLQSTCGAVTGAYMVLGLYCGEKYGDNGERKEQSYRMIRSFNQQFVDKYGTTECRMLLNCDLTTEEGQARFRNENLGKRVCENCITDSVQFLSEQIDNSAL